MKEGGGLHTFCGMETRALVRPTGVMQVYSGFFFVLFSCV